MFENPNLNVMENNIKKGTEEDLNNQQSEDLENNSNLKSVDKLENNLLDIDPVIFARAKRNIAFANSLQDLEKNEMQENDFVIARAILERRFWAKIMNKLEAGDQVVTVLTPSNKFLNIKNLNDNVFGPQRTDSIIARRREYATKAFNDYLTKIINSKKDWIEKFSNLDDLNLNQSFKQGVYRIPSEMVNELNLAELLDFISQEVDTQIEKEIAHDLDLALIEAQNNNDDQKIKNIEQFKIDFARDGFKVNCGVAQVRDNNIKNKVLSLARSLQAAKINSLDGIEDKTGRIFSESELKEVVAQVDLIREDIINNGNIIINQDGYQFAIFSQVSGGKFKLDKDLLRDVRKEKFEPQDETQREILRKLIKYKEALNIIDFIKPFPSDNQDKFETELNEINELEKILKNKDQENYFRVKEKLQANEKDNRFISNELFESESIKINHCTYLSLDVLDIGVDQLLKYEELLQDFGKGDKNLQDISVSADDFITKRLQTIRKKVADIVSNYEDGKLLNQDGLVIASLGGDEICLTIDNSKIKGADLDKMILALKEATNTRVIKTVIAENERDSNSTDLDIRLKEHLLALNRSEKGVSQIKEIEVEIRKLKLYLKNEILVEDLTLNKEDLEILNNEFNVQVEKDISDLGLDSLIAIEDEKKQIKFKSLRNGKLYNQKEVFDIINDIKIKYKKNKKRGGKGGQDVD